MLILSLVLILLFFVIYKRHKQMSTFKKLRIPGPRPNFIFGNLIDIGSEGFNGVFQKWTKTYGPIVGFYIGGRPQLLVTDIELIRRLLIKDFHKFSARGEIIPGGIHPVPQLRKTLIWSVDNTWKHLRASLSPSFSPHKLNSMEPLMMSSIDKCVSELDSKANRSEEFNLKSLLTDFILASSVKCIFGLDFSLNQLFNDAKTFLEVTRPRLDKSILAMVMVLFPSMTFLAYPLRVWWERFRFYMLWSPEGVCYDVTKKIVQIRREAGIQSVDFLQLLMNTKRIQTTVIAVLEMSEDVKRNNLLLSKESQNENISEVEIVSNAMIFLMASHETTSTTIQFCLHNLINHENIQEDLRIELRKAVEKCDKTISYSTLSKVPLLNRIVKETLRMFPPLPHGTTRVANENYKYQDIVIPKGTTVFIGVSSIHNNPTFWPEPEEFRPERFEHDYDKLSYLPFSSGPRNCIGIRFAYMEVELFLANLILKYRFEPGPSTEKKIEIMETTVTSIPKNGVFCKVTRLKE